MYSTAKKKKKKMNKNLIKRYARKLSIETGTPVSVDEAEAEIVRVMQRVCRMLAPQFKFGYHSVEDIEQQGVIEAIEVLAEDGKYDVSRPLENFLYVHVHNSLSNFRRKHFMRYEPPCGCCDPHLPPAFPCSKFRDWQSRNFVKRNLMQPLDMANVADESEVGLRDESVVEDDAMASELRALLDGELPVELRKDYLQMLDGKLLPKARRERVREAVLEIMRGRGYFDAEEG